MYVQQKALAAFTIWIRQLRRSAWTLIALCIAVRIIGSVLNGAGVPVS